jgi:hypothetical protein
VISALTDLVDEDIHRNASVRPLIRKKLVVNKAWKRHNSNSDA